MSKKLVSFFSATGVTAAAAKHLAAAIGAELYEIKPEIPYVDADLDWTDLTTRTSVEMNNKSFRPALADHNAMIESFDTIFVGFPIWWYFAVSS